MAWLRYVGGRLKSDYRYSKDLVYNTFPFPADLTPKLEEKVEAAARAVLEARAGFPQSSLADLYDPLTMPPALRSAHTALDKAVEACYRPGTFSHDRERIEFLLERYAAMRQVLLSAAPAVVAGRRSRGRK